MVFLRRLGEYEMTEFLVRHFVKDYENTSKVSVRTAYGVLASVTGIFCNILLFAAKWLLAICFTVFLLWQMHLTTCLMQVLRSSV